MVNVKFNSTAQRHTAEVVASGTTIREYLESKGAYMSATFSIAGKVINNLDMTFAQLDSLGVDTANLITIYETIKSDNA